jgi:Zn-finger nucleic acid-binding protein
MSERQGVEIDYCQQCRGVWLDRGELDKILDRTAAGGGDSTDVRDHPQQVPNHANRDDRSDRDPSGKKPKKRSFLSEIFEFGE